MEAAMTDEHPGYIKGKTLELTSDNDELGELMFGASWPCVKASLAESEARPREPVVVRVTKVVPR
jgi:hypothetical protein